MTKLLQFLIKHLAFLYNEYQASFTSDGIDKGRASYCGNVKLKIKHLIVNLPKFFCFFHFQVLLIFV
jgi:hypothetical protein